MRNYTVCCKAHKSFDPGARADLLTGAQRNDFDIAVIASGDKDYIPVVEAVKRMNKKVYIASFSKALAYGMDSISDDIIDLDGHIKDISLQMNAYKCADCGVNFELPFKLYPGAIPYCRDCIKEHRR